MPRNTIACFAGLCAALIVALGIVSSSYPAMAKKLEAKPLKIMVYGDNGIAMSIVDEALRRGHAVTLVVDKPEDVAKSSRNLTVVKGDVADLRDVARKIASENFVFAVIGSGDAHSITTAANSFVLAARIVGAFAPEIVWIGGASALEDESGNRLIAALPPEARTGADLGQVQALAYFQKVSDLLWTYLTLPPEVTSGKRTGKFRVGDGHVLKDANGKSIISAEDLAVAAIDEAEKPQHTYAQFSVAY